MAFLRELRGNSLNPQTSSGLDVYSRISFANSPSHSSRAKRFDALKILSVLAGVATIAASTSIHVEHVFAMDLAVGL